MEIERKREERENNQKEKQNEKNDDIINIPWVTPPSAEIVKLLDPRTLDEKDNAIRLFATLEEFFSLV